MIKVIVSYRNNKIIEIAATGHAGFADKGEDLVCAGVSSIIIGSANALYEMCAIEDIVISNKQSVLKSDGSEKANHILETTYYQLKTMEDQYSKFIHIQTQEV
ncbi:MAG: ribosomal-processing cysteine protease Prp [Erysipelotrichaceae bacterium]|nr:ribosomal-processing cysteine protease Prp [Erysipelotrichaceae bacterium]